MVVVGTFVGWRVGLADSGAVKSDVGWKSFRKERKRHRLDPVIK